MRALPPRLQRLHYPLQLHLQLHFMLLRLRGHPYLGGNLLLLLLGVQDMLLDFSDRLLQLSLSIFLLFCQQ